MSDDLIARLRAPGWIYRDASGKQWVDDAPMQAAAEITRLRAQVEAGRDRIEARVDAVVRRNFVAPEDTAVEALCLRYGYGAVMDAASRLWARSDLLGAFYIGGCIGFHTEEEARAALAIYQQAKEGGE